MRRRSLSALCLLVLLALASPATGHGPTVRVSYKGVQPAQLVVEVGQTVHFHNANSSGAVCTVVAKDGSFASPPLGRAEGFHFTFEKAGDFAYEVREFPSAAGRVLVVEPSE